MLLAGALAPVSLASSSALARSARRAVPQDAAAGTPDDGRSDRPPAQATPDYVLDVGTRELDLFGTPTPALLANEQIPLQRCTYPNDAQRSNQAVAI